MTHSGRRLVPTAIGVVLVALPAGVRAQAGGIGFGPVRDTDYRENGNYDTAKVELGRLLFFDELLSGNRNISCATCHHPDNASGDALSLAIGEGGIGIGVGRSTGTGTDRVPARVPRNSPALFNLGARQFGRLFHDGRVAVDGAQDSGFDTPAGDDLPSGLDNVLAAQALFPLTSTVEMAGQRAENKIAKAAARGRLAGNNGVWGRLAKRLRNVPAYVTLFRQVFDDVDAARDINIVHAANAIAAFEMSALRSDNSPFDRFLRGNQGALSAQARRGMNLFYGQAGCARCHAGPFQTDGRFHSIALPQVGPGTGGGGDGRDDFGRANVTGNVGDRYRFRTPSLRNVELTAPYGHDGAYSTLANMVRHYRDPARELRAYDPNQLILPSRVDLDAEDLVVMSDPARVAAIAASNQARPSRLDNVDVADLVAFLRSLTDPSARDLGALVPDSVPSGLITR
ncbi:MAG: c-type cytochrome [Acidobacteria bacterium]|nr:c-type cytochrome [Acidobacteriota bacterium]